MRDVRVISWHIGHQPRCSCHIRLGNISRAPIVIVWEGARFVEWLAPFELAGGRHGVEDKAHVNGGVDGPGILERLVYQCGYGLGNGCGVGFIGRRILLGIKGRCSGCGERPASWSLLGLGLAIVRAGGGVDGCLPLGAGLNCSLGPSAGRRRLSFRGTSVIPT